MEISYKYVLQCRHNTLNDITPADVTKYNTVGYKAIIEIGKQYIQEKGLKEFSSNFQGNQYFVELWTAHIIFEYGNPNSDLKIKCVKIIREYSDNPLSPKVSKEEKEWLVLNAEGLDS
jgi:hypothetical protein